MNQLERQNLIVNYLRIKPVNHGQVYTSQIAVPKSEVGEIPVQRREVLKNSLTQQGSNLIPLIVRRTEAYSEEEEYEVVYGADWCLVAKEIYVEKLWVWVFDMTDEQASSAKIQMEQLVSSRGVYSSDSNDIEQLKQQFQILENSLRQQLENISKKIDKLIPEEKMPPSLNILTVSKNELEVAINNKNQANAAWTAIEYLKATNRKLTKENFDKLVKAKSGRDKIKGFASGTFNKLKEVIEIPD